MSKLEQRLIEDRELRDAARANLMAEIEHAKEAFSAKGVFGRVGGRIGDGAKDVLEVAKFQAEDKRGILALLIGAILLWLGRQPLLEALGLDEETDTALPQTAESEDAPSAPLTPDDDDIPGDNNER
ncbi:hypothetical protein NAP1_04955 [Erythrobacter sp. NAP1]|uniref:hypothetical protein n=1 Tax=Erythrobacter sp. NAP1 TaxID=237727 RepID=UPI0000686A63|nr:hypothetical protein [Erythrobacter sp. NAP1]EAQ30097.1 hypothetical protein NAP1_04955 [Erythrobacter sp. NAP1]